jgi:hypothetical protein
VGSAFVHSQGNPVSYKRTLAVAGFPADATSGVALHHLEISFTNATGQSKVRKAGRWTDAERLRLFVDVCLQGIGSSRADIKKLDDPRDACELLSQQERPFIRLARKYSEGPPHVDEQGQRWRTLKPRGARAKDDVWLSRRRPSSRFPRHQAEWDRMMALVHTGKARAHFVTRDKRLRLLRVYYEHLGDIATDPALFAKTVAALAAAYAARHSLSNESYYNSAERIVQDRLVSRQKFLSKRR